MAIVDLMSMSERRIDRLVNPDKNEGLAAFLAQRPGLESGIMTAHVAAASLVNAARVLAHPASIDNITTSGGKEDHFFFQAEDGIRDLTVTGVQTCALPI